MKKYNAAIILGITCLILVLAICIQIRTIEEASNVVGSSLNDNSEMKDKVLETQEDYKQIYSELEKSNKKLEKIRQIATSNSQEDELLKLELEDNDRVQGLTDVKGKGIIINLDDNREVDETEVLNISSYLVHEEDLLQIINELFNAGADAISINNQRVVSTTAILCDGNIIRVNGEIISVPITIKAIGYPESLYYALMRPQGYLDVMQKDGVIVKVEKSDDITISKYEGVYNYDYIIGGDE
ncbi:MAG: DUF881 domain-containing protein [Clostridiales bacterium]|nr:DUF881 domain-containing protein [Clostridiales bacterium]